ncbi:MAG TPA: hypothetical protein VFP59_02965 [Candidatus Angelobacter sp.]|nr:hypothetical protein [Candidatus Angelobacter sp.]
MLVVSLTATELLVSVSWLSCALEVVVIELPNKPKNENPVVIEAVTFTPLVNELLIIELVPSIVLLLYMTELADPGGAYVTVSTTYFGSTKPARGVGAGVGVGVGVGNGVGVGKVHGLVN